MYLKGMKARLLIVSIFGLLLWSCSIGPKDIKYSHDACHYCSMTVVDNQHASELVTKTGKVFIFDSVECLVHHIQDNQGVDHEGMVLVNTYTKPGVLFDATKATYLISENIPSPMGAFLTAFPIDLEAEEVQQTQGGTLYHWEELLASLP